MKPAKAVVLALILLAQIPWASDLIRLKKRNIDTGQPGSVSARGAAELEGAESARRVRRRHYILHFRSYPGAELVQELTRRGIKAVAYVPDSALMVSSTGRLNLEGLDVSWSGALETSDKISGALETDPSGAYLVIFHGDVEAAQARSLAKQAGFTVIERPDLLAGHLVVSGAYDGIATLAANDEVAYILPASADLAAGRRVFGCVGPLTEAGAVGEYVLVGSGWSADAGGGVALKYFFKSLTAKIESSSVQSEVQRAFAEWARYANVTFSAGQAAQAARSIDILFATGAHGDSYAFDGSGGSLAHTFYPAPPNSETIAGDMHFDNAEDWHVGSDVDLFSVALHEAGHALGLGHSDHSTAVMYPYYRLTSGLSDDDITGVRALYGAATTTSSGNPTQTSPTSPTSPTTPTTGTGADTTKPSLRIVSPSLTIVSTSAATLTFSGTASDNVGVALVTWTTSTGGSGTASGTTSWSATIPLLVGDNVVKIQVYDGAGNSAWRTVTVVRR